MSEELALTNLRLKIVKLRMSFLANKYRTSSEEEAILKEIEELKAQVTSAEEKKKQETGDLRPEVLRENPRVSMALPMRFWSTRFSNLNEDDEAKLSEFDPDINDSNMHTGEVRDLSKSGVCFTTSQIVLPGSCVWLEIYQPDKKIKAKAVIMRIEKDKLKRYIVGAHFINLDEEAQKTLNWLLRPQASVNFS